MIEISNSNAADTLGVIRALSRQARISWIEALAEAIDNSLDAGASKVKIQIDTTKGRSRLRITDDGKGCSQPSVMVSPGCRRDHDTTELGRNGIGLKDALFTLCGERHTSIIRTVVEVGEERHFITYVTDWARAWETGSVKGDAHVLAARAEQVGTTIEAKPLKPDVRAPALEQTVSRIGYLYSPALKSGKSITIEINGKERIAGPWEPPPFARSVAREFARDGRRFRVTIGVVAPGTQNKREGLTHVQGFRVVEAHPGRGLGTADTSRICGVVELLDGFILDKNKGALLDAEAEFVTECLCGDPEIMALVEEAESQSHDLTLEQLRSEATSLLNISLGRAEPTLKAKRSGVKNPGAGTVEPTGTGPGHRQARRTQPGRTFGGAHTGSLKVTFVDRGEDEPPVTADSRSGNVAFNTSHPRFDALKAGGAQVLVTAAIFAWSVAAAGHAAGGAQAGWVSTEEVFLTVDKFMRATVALNGSRVFESDAAAE